MSSLFQAPPDGWQRTTLRHLVQGPKNGAWGSEAGEDEIDAVCVRVADFDWSRLTLKLEDPTTRSFRKQQFKNLQLRRGDIVIEKSGGGEKTPVGRVVSFDEDVDAVTSNFVARIRPRASVLNRFFLYLLAAHYMSGYSHQFIKQNTGIQNLDDANLFRSDVWIPDLATQRQIADFLDRETARIDLLIEKKQKLVALLGEKFETETTRLMTRGVMGEKNEFVQSVYHWAPEVPIHWTQTPLRQLLRLASGSVGEKSADYVLLSLTKQGVIPRDVESGKGKFPAEFSAYQVVKPNQLVLCLFDIDETPRTVGLSSHFGMITGAYTVADINSDRVSRDFIYLHLLYLDNGKRLRPFYTGLRKVVRPQTFLNIRIPLPSMSEQEQIVQQLRFWEKTTQEISAKTSASIDRLKEYRSALITAAVTGQIDVTTYAKSGATDRLLDAIQEEMGA